MKMLILSGLILLSAAISEAAGRNEAYKICESISSSSSKASCAQSLSKYSYFDEGAINACISISSSSTKATCVESIGDKSYEAYEIKLCSEISSSSSKNDCLQNSGTVANVMQPHPGPDHDYGCISKRELQRELNRLDRLVYLGDNGRALQVIRRLQSDVSCNN